MAKYRVKEFQGVFEINEDDQYEFPKDEHCTYNTTTEWDKTFCPTQVAAQALFDRYANTNEDIMEEFLDQFSIFRYGRDDYGKRHWLCTDIDDGDTVEFIAISIEEI